MRRDLPIPAVLLAATLALNACTAARDGDSTGKAEPAAKASAAPAGGGLGPGALGGLLGRVPGPDGASPAPAAIGGRLLSGPYQAQLEDSDIARAHRAAVAAFDRVPSGQTKIWRNPTNGHWGTLTPTRTYTNAEGRYCRDYRQTVTLGGQEYQGNGTVCFENGAGDGRTVWRVMS
ncbi:MAG: hypothetical protein MJE12_26655 [Alphaproteobacteria bacterium]|nr:hypothetical protein [Alphaproteobacteria bacterium]